MECLAARGESGVPDRSTFTTDPTLLGALCQEMAGVLATRFFNEQ